MNGNKQYTNFDNEVQVDITFHSDYNRVYIAGSNLLMPITFETVNKMIEKEQFAFFEKQIKEIRNKVKEVEKYYKERLKTVDPLLYKAKKAIK